MRTIITILSLALTTAIYAQKDKSYNLHWQENGNVNTQSIETVYSEKGKFYYYLSNDKDNLYVVLKVFDKDVQRQILISGLTVWINTDDKKAKKTGLRYPARMQKQGKPYMAGMANQQAPKNQQAPQDQQTPQNNQRYGNMQSPKTGMPGGEGPSGARNMQMPVDSRIELIGISGSGDNSFISSEEANNFKGSIRFENNGNMWYQLVIPLSKMPDKSVKNKNADGSFMLGFSYAGISTQPMGGGSGAPGGGRGGDMSRFGGGSGRGMGAPGGGGRGRPGGRPGGASAPGAISASTVTVWIKDLQFATE